MMSDCPIQTSSERYTAERCMRALFAPTYAHVASLSPPRALAPIGPPSWCRVAAAPSTRVPPPLAAPPSRRALLERVAAMVARNDGDGDDSCSIVDVERALLAVPGARTTLGRGAVREWLVRHCDGYFEIDATRVYAMRAPPSNAWDGRRAVTALPLDALVRAARAAVRAAPARPMAASALLACVADRTGSSRTRGFARMSAFLARLELGGARVERVDDAARLDGGASFCYVDFDDNDDDDDDASDPK